MLDGGGDSGGAILGAGIFFSGVAGGSTGGRIAVFVGASVVLAFAVFAVSPATAASKAPSMTLITFTSGSEAGRWQWITTGTVAPFESGSS